MAADQSSGSRITWSKGGLTQPEMKLLFEYAEAEYRAVLNIQRSKITREVQSHLKNAGVYNPAVYVLSFTATPVKLRRKEY